MNKLFNKKIISNYKFLIHRLPDSVYDQIIKDVMNIAKMLYTNKIPSPAAITYYIFSNKLIFC